MKIYHLEKAPTSAGFWRIKPTGAKAFVALWLALLFAVPAIGFQPGDQPNAGAEQAAPQEDPAAQANQEKMNDSGKPMQMT